MFGLDMLLMQATTSTGNVALDSVIAVIVSVGIIAGIAAPYLKKLNGRLNTVGQYADTFAQKTAEQEETFYRFGKAARAAVPELDSELKKYELPLSSIEKRVTGAKDQLEFFRNRTSEKMHAASLNELPRESVRVDLKRRADDDADAI